MARLVELETARLRLRHWRDADLAPFAALNADPAVMEFYPSVLARAESDALAARIRAALAERGWGLWAVEARAEGAFLGYVGLEVPALDLPVSPCVEIGWRLAAAHWGRGYASEAARAALAFGFDELGLHEIVSFTAVANARSRAVMERIGLAWSGETFLHPRLAADSPLRTHVVYRARRD
jgi:RimJ/RimL family protein N-acetyltransferase